MFPSQRQCIVVLLLIFLIPVGLCNDDRNWRKGVMRLSDGSDVKGEMSFRDNSLRIFHNEQERHYDVPIEDVSRIDTLIEREYMYEKWIFREDGRDEKLFTGDKYPIRRLTHRITFPNDRTITGKIMSRPFYIRSPEDGMKRYALKRKMEGNVGNDMEDLTYVKSIVFTEQGEGLLGTIRGSVDLPSPQTLLRVIGFNTDINLSLMADIQPDGRFVIHDAPGGAYTFLVIAGTRRSMGNQQRPDATTIYCSLHSDNDDQVTKLGDQTLEEIRKWKTNVRSVFDEEQPVYGTNQAGNIYVLVRMDRTSNLEWSNPEQWEWVKMLKRFEVWHMTQQDDQWEIQKRHFLHRELLTDTDNPPEKVVVDPRLYGHTLDQDSPELELKFNLKQQE